jgi:hypothetical protein
MVSDVPEAIKEVTQIKEIKAWAFNFIVVVLVKDVAVTCVWWATLYWQTGDIGAVNPWEAGGFDHLADGFYDIKHRWWYRLWCEPLLAHHRACASVSESPNLKWPPLPPRTLRRPPMGGHWRHLRRRIPAVALRSPLRIDA